MTAKSRRANRPKQTRRNELLLFGAMLVLLVVKYLNITKLGGNMTQFLTTYKFVFTDSFDWLATGVTLFHNESITLRNPGLPLVVKFLNHFGIVYLLPLLNQLVFLGLVVAVYYTVKHLTKSAKFAGFFAILVFTNYTFNLLTNYILADMYAVTAIAIALYLLLTKRYAWSFVALGVSMLFQNFAYFLYIMWCAYYAIEHWTALKALLNRKGSIQLQKLNVLIPLAIPGLMVLPWHLYKLAIYGNPFYTKVDQLAVVDPTLSNLSFYSYHALIMWGPLLLITILATVVTLIKKPSFFANKTMLFLLSGFIFSAVFWGVFYDWPDRRFLLYITPWFYALSGVIVYRFVPKTPRPIKYGLALVAIYIATLPVVFVEGQKTFPLVDDTVVTVDLQAQSEHLRIGNTEGFDSPLMNVSPSLYDSFDRAAFYKQEESGKYVTAERMVKLTYDSQKVCVERDASVKPYITSSVTLILYPDVNLDKLKQTCK
ncbi:hypothetical protein KA047_02135 [Candidatus Saccharibacteria bacterium]|nr:hypothetical protein [Candidatus Saccharibacteria bacterium]